MAYLLSSERPARAAVAVTPIRGFFRWLAKARTERTQRTALQNLLDLDAAMLDDLGINRQDVVDAMRNPPRSAGEALAARRALNARNWLSR